MTGISTLKTATGTSQAVLNFNFNPKMIRKIFNRQGEGLALAIPQDLICLSVIALWLRKPCGTKSFMLTRKISIFRKIGKSRKIKRPLSFKNSTHLVLRLKANLPQLFEPRDFRLRKHFFQIAEKYNIRVYRLIFNHTHVHAAVLFPDRLQYVRFIRELTSFLVRYFT